MNIIAKPIINKIHTILLFALCLGLSCTLYATQPKKVKDKKAHRQASPPSNTGNRPIMLTSNRKPQVYFRCKSIKACKAITTVLDCLQYWQKVNNDIEQLGKVFEYFSPSNSYRDIVGAYHHLLDKHLDGRYNKEAFRFITGRVQQQITCNFATCKGYHRNQRDRGDGAAAIFIRDTLDTIHAYLIHGSDSGHLYSLSKHKPIKYASNDDQKEAEIATSYTLFDQEMSALKKWQEKIKNKSRTQKKTKFSTKIVEIAQHDTELSFELLAAHVKNTPTLAAWLQYLCDNECDTDVLLHNIDDDIEDNIVYNGFKGDKKIAIAVANLIHNKAQAKQTPADRKKTSSYGFGVRLYYWDHFKHNEDIAWHDLNYRYSDLYVAPAYTSFKNEILAKGIALCQWNQKMYAAQLMLAQSATLSAVKADGLLQYNYDIQSDTGLSIWHILSIMLHTDFTALYPAFRASLYYLSPSESLQDVKERNSKWYHLSRYLREVVEVFGTQIYGWDGLDQKKDIKRDIYYHQVSYRLFAQLSVHWYGPLSTSKQMEVPILLSSSTNDGLLLALKEDDHRLRFFNVCLLSSFGAEDERLFIGGKRPMQIATIHLLKDNINLKQVIHALLMLGTMIRKDLPGTDEKVLPIDAAICKDLMAASSKLPAYAQHIWDAFRRRQQRITIDMGDMYAYYKGFIPLLFDRQHKHVLLLDRIAQLFPNLTEIICQEVDCIGLDQWSNSAYSSAIVCTKFMLAVQDRLRKMPTHAKLTKIIIRTYRYGDGLKEDCKLYATPFGALGWQIGQGRHTILLTTDAYDAEALMAKVSTMIQGEIASYEATSLDMPIFSQFILGPKALPAELQKRWNVYRHQQQKIIINMHYMYPDYAAFMPLLFDPKCKHVLLLDSMVQLFPNVTEIICKDTDYDGYKTTWSPAIVCDNFMLGLKERLQQIHKQAKLTKIIIQTAYKAITDRCKLYPAAFDRLDWLVQKAVTKKEICLVKQTADGGAYKDVVDKVSAMIQKKRPYYQTTPVDMTIFNRLLAGGQDIPTHAAQIWKKLRQQQQRITIDMRYMYKYYKAFMPLLCASDPKFKNVLLLDKIVYLFPNVIQITCENTDNITGGCNQKDYSSSIVCANFMVAIQDCLSKLPKQAKLTTVIIQAAKYSDEIKTHSPLDAIQLTVLGWQIKQEFSKNKQKNPKKNCQITLTKLAAPKPGYANASGLEQNISSVSKNAKKDKKCLVM